jgi:hypothetical protein
MTVRAKFRVNATRQQIGYDNQKQEVVELSAVMDEANKQWSQYTPQGKVEMHITNPAALEQFPIGSHFYVDFTPAPAVDPKPAG